MFTGIVELTGQIRRLESQSDMVLADIYAPEYVQKSRLIVGESIAHNGVCLTVTDYFLDRGEYRVALSPETLTCTSGLDVLGAELNLERALRVGDRLGGHYVSGHVDTVGTVEHREDKDQWTIMRISYLATWAKFIAKKGSIAVQGVSLTVNEVGDDWFDIGLIPHTLQTTNLKFLQTGEPVNLEVDVLARYVARMQEVNSLTNH
jgi:riboflavin synthase